MTNWFRQHAYALRSALSHLRAAPGNFLFNVLVMAIALSLPIAGLTIIDNLRPVASQLSINPELSVFLKTELSSQDAAQFQTTLRQILKDQHIQAKLRYIPKDQALAELESTSSLAEVMASLGNNPLPDAYVLGLEHQDRDKLTQLSETIKTFQQVELVQIDSAWVKRLAALTEVLQTALLFLGITLGLVVVVVVFNATRLQVLSHQAEISVSRLLGATNRFIHKPYDYAGVMLGTVAGGLALGLVAMALIPLNQAITQFAQLYASEFQLAPLGWLPSVILILISQVLAWFGAYLSVRRQLKKLPI